MRTRVVCAFKGGEGLSHHLERVGLVKRRMRFGVGVEIPFHLNTQTLAPSSEPSCLNLFRVTVLEGLTWCPRHTYCRLFYLEGTVL